MRPLRCRSKSVAHPVSLTATTLKSSGHREHLLRRGRRRAMSQPFDEPLVVIALNEGSNDRAGLVERAEPMDPEALFLQRPHEAFDHAVALWLANERGTVRNPEPGQLVAKRVRDYVSRQLGHKDVTITLRVYAHWLPDASKGKLVNLLDDTGPSASQAHPTASERDDRIAVNGWKISG